MSKHLQTITVGSKNPPTVEIDSQAKSAYVRFSRNKVARTKSVDKEGIIIAIDFDGNGEVIGIELVGVSEFSVKSLLNLAPVTAPKIQNWDRTK
ncbi:MAG: DUF2283 domain-containing protein, partial [Verrucomicrobiota bacterium]|nr:DUF2283 domain-containing protein [Verrucomicrobiota bacterium]